MSIVPDGLHTLQRISFQIRSFYPFFRTRPAISKEGVSDKRIACWHSYADNETPLSVVGYVRIPVDRREERNKIFGTAPQRVANRLGDVQTMFERRSRTETICRVQIGAVRRAYRSSLQSSQYLTVSVSAPGDAQC